MEEVGDALAQPVDARLICFPAFQPVSREVDPEIGKSPRNLRVDIFAINQQDVRWLGFIKMVANWLGRRSTFGIC